MTPEAVAAVRHVLPETLAFNYYDDRESAWLLSRAMGERVSVATLKAGPLARFLNKPLVKPIVARCGGTLALEDVAAVANADRVSWDTLSAAAADAMLVAHSATWRDFELSFDTWGLDFDPYFDQMTREGGNLVVQLGFPSDHAMLMGSLCARHGRKVFEYEFHPVRQVGRPTLAWARVDLEDGVALIEEVQSDWLRVAGYRAAYARRHARSRQLKALALYGEELSARYGKLWPRAMLLATLVVLGDHLGVREVFMHQPRPGAILKGIVGIEPPVSLYTKLPKSFGFTPTRDVPPFLKRSRKRQLAKLAKQEETLFWRLTL